MLVVTMMDVAKEQGKEIDINKLSKTIGIPVVGLVAPDKKSYGSFFDTLEEAVRNPKAVEDQALYELYEGGSEKEIWKNAKALAEEVCDERRTADWLAGKLLEQDAAVFREISIRSGKDMTKYLGSESANGALYTSDCKFRWIESILKGTVSKKKKPRELLSRFDHAAISTRWGKPIAVGILLLSLIGSMVVAMPVMALGGALPGILNGPLAAGLSSAGVSAGMIRFIESTFMTALGWVISMLGFVFGINLVFGLVEEVGYMARVSYAFDGTMGRLGLQGKAIMPILTGFGCTIGGAAGTRVMDTWGQRILTMAVVWAVPCGATFAVIPTLAASFFGWGGILVMILIFAIMFVHILFTAKVFGNKLNPKEDRAGLIMELPPYHKPRWGFLFRQALNRVWAIFKKAFNVPCLQAVVSTYQESHSLKWTLRIAAYYIGTALILSCVVYHAAVLFF